MQALNGGKRHGRLLVDAVLAGLLSMAFQQAAAAADAPQAVPVKVGKVGRTDLPIYLHGLGTVQAWQAVTARAQVNGYLTEVDFHEGQPVRKGDLLAMIDPRPYAALLAQAKAKRAGDAATLANYQVNQQRDSVLARDSYATRQQADNDMALVRQFQANLLGDDAAIMQAQLNLDFCRIVAPIDGVAGFRLVDVGNLIEASAQTPIVTIEQIHPIAVVFTLAEQDLPQVQAATTQGALSVLAAASGGKARLGSGILVAPNNTVDASTGTISFKAVFQNRRGLLWPGQYVNVDLRLSVRHDAVVVPLDAVQHGPSGLYVYLARPDHTVRNQPITVGYQNDSMAMVTSGLRGGESVVLDGQSRLQDGARIAPQPSGST